MCVGPWAFPLPKKKTCRVRRVAAPAFCFRVALPGAGARALLGLSFLPAAFLRVPAAFLRAVKFPPPIFL
jgi:hypothetical protein